MIKGTTFLVDAATVAWDLSAGADYKVTITSNRVLGAFTNGTPGQEGTLTVAQDATGGWSFDLSNAVYDFWGPSIENVARGPNDETVYEYKVISAGSMFLRRKGATTIGGAGRDLLAVFTANNSPTIDIVLVKWLLIYDRFEIDIEDLLPSSNDAGLWVRTSSNGGSTYDSGASDYSWVLHRISDGPTHAADSDGLASKIELIKHLVNGMSSVAGETAAGRIVIHSPKAAAPCKISWQIDYIPANDALRTEQNTGIGKRAAFADVDALRFLCGAGNFVSGIFRLYGIGG